MSIIFYPLLPQKAFTLRDAVPNSDLSTSIESALNYYEKGEYAKSEAIVLKLIKKNPSNYKEHVVLNYKAHVILLAIYMMSRIRYADAVILAKNLLIEYPKDYKVLDSLCNLLQVLSRYNEIVPLLERHRPYAGASDKQKAYYYYLLAKAYKEDYSISTKDIRTSIQAKWRKGMDFLPLSLNLDPDNAKAHALLGKIKVEMGCSWASAGNKEKRDQALEAGMKNLQTAVSLNPKLISAQIDIGEAYRCKKDFARSVAAFEAYLKKGGEKSVISLELQYLKRDIKATAIQNPRDHSYKKLLNSPLIKTESILKE